MSYSILSVSIRSEYDTVAARQRARQIGQLLGFDRQDQTRISTAVSEIARNAFNYAGGGRVEYLIEGRVAPQLLLIKVSDAGKGIRNLASVLDGTYRSETGMGLGIIGARRLMDQFQIESNAAHGTTIWLKKLLPKRAPLLKETDIGKLADSLARQAPQDAFHELQHQNQELIAALEEIRTRQNELLLLNRELEDTNRGVVALYAELDEKADHLRRADELKSKFLSNMSHEFRSPLNSILALSGLLLARTDGDLSGEQVQQVEYIRHAADDLLELVNDLLDLAKVAAGKLEVKPLEFQVSNLFGALRGMLRPLLLNQSVNLVFEDVDQIPVIFGDEGKISQVLRNFISNALKFTESGEVRVGARLDHRDTNVIFSVSDTGIGIAPENLERIFEDFSQVDSPIQRRVKGTGLGLPLSKKLATVLGGAVRVKSALGEGSTFTLEIPLRYPDTAQQPIEPAAEWNPQPGKLPVLILEDNAAMKMMYTSFLEGSPFQPVHASTIREAEEILEQFQPVAMVLDIVLRSEDTWTFLARHAEDARARGIPLLVVSSIEDQGKAYQLGASAYLVKPIERMDLLCRLTLSNAQSVSRILIIDDDERARYILKHRLRGSAFVVLEASGGREGIRKATEERPHLIILDINMPDMSGFEVMDGLKGASATKDIPVVICTSRTLSAAERTDLTAKAAAILAKEGLDQSAVAEQLQHILSGAGVADAIQ